MEPLQASESGGSRQICTFTIADRLLGVDILHVKEINTETEFTPIHHAPREVKGYVNIRGQIHLILDLRLLMDLPEKPVDEESRLVLFKPAVGENFGILVDRIGDVLAIDPGAVEERRRAENGMPGSGDRRGREIGAGVCKLAQGLLILLNTGVLLDCIGLDRTEGSGPP